MDRLARNLDDLRRLVRLRGLHPELAAILSQWQSFAQMLRDQCDEHPRCQLEQWMVKTAGTNVPELQAFVTKLRQDVDAVVAALTLPYSQGQTEGRVNRLKLIKRSMYGHATFNLLRQLICCGNGYSTRAHPDLLEHHRRFTQSSEEPPKRGNPKREQTAKVGGVKAKRLKAGWDEQYLRKVLAQ